MIDNIMLVIVGMSLVTYIPRAVPLVALTNVRVPGLLKRFLQNIPYAALGALIFPDILSSTGDVTLSLAGGICALLLAYLELNLVVVIAGSIGTVYLLHFFI